MDPVDLDIVLAHQRDLVCVRQHGVKWCWWVMVVRRETELLRQKPVGLVGTLLAMFLLCSVSVCLS